MNATDPVMLQRQLAGSRRRFWIFALGTVLVIYLLILVGGVVRATGSGMGCPDWPMCFGRWIPPTSEAQLPPDYQTIYAERGYADTRFNVRKTWTEYLNRLLGVFTGFTILLTALFAWPLRRRHARVWWFAFSGLLLVMVQGWLGSRVVASNLDPAMITLHMLLAQAIVGLIIAAVVYSLRERWQSLPADVLPPGLHRWLVLAMGLCLLQLILGTQVREAVDLIASHSNYENRHLWIDNLPMIFETHKWLAWVVVAVNGWVVLQVVSHGKATVLSGLSLLLAVLLVGTVVMGMAMDRLNLPIFAQPLHLFLSSLILGVQLAIYLIYRESRTPLAPA